MAGAPTPPQRTRQAAPGGASLQAPAGLLRAPTGEAGAGPAHVVREPPGRQRAEVAAGGGRVGHHPQCVRVVLARRPPGGAQLHQVHKVLRAEVLLERADDPARMRQVAGDKREAVGARRAGGEGGGGAAPAPAPGPGLLQPARHVHHLRPRAASSQKQPAGRRARSLEVLVLWRLLQCRCHGVALASLGTAIPRPGWWAGGRRTSISSICQAGGDTCRLRSGAARWVAGRLGPWGFPPAAGPATQQSAPSPATYPVYGIAAPTDCAASRAARQRLGCNPPRVRPPATPQRGRQAAIRAPADRLQRLVGGRWRRGRGGILRARRVQRRWCFQTAREQLKCQFLVVSLGGTAPVGLTLTSRRLTCVDAATVAGCCRGGRRLLPCTSCKIARSAHPRSRAAVNRAEWTRGPQQHAERGGPTRGLTSIRDRLAAVADFRGPVLAALPT
jgi:hypothetical protein